MPNNVRYALGPLLKTLALLAGTASFTVSALATNLDWPQWRGPDRDGVSKETGLLKSWPADGPKRVWVFENAGTGYSAPAIEAGKLFTMGTRDNSEIVLVLDANTGKELWNHRGFGTGAVTYADGRLSCLDEGSGTVALVEASPSGWKEHGRFKLNPQTKIRTPEGRIWTHPVISHGKLYLRDQDLICCYDVKEN